MADESIESMLGRLDERTENIHEIVTANSEKLGVQNGRIKNLELWRSYILGFLACATLASPLLIYEVRLLILHFVGG